MDPPCFIHYILCYEVTWGIHEINFLCLPFLSKLPAKKQSLTMQYLTTVPLRIKSIDDFPDYRQDKINI